MELLLRIGSRLANRYVVTIVTQVFVDENDTGTDPSRADSDGDGFGDIPYKLRRLSSQLESTYPQLQFFRGGITLRLLDALSSLFPMIAPETTLIDPRPRMSSSDWEGFDAR